MIRAMDGDGFAAPIAIAGHVVDVLAALRRASGVEAAIDVWLSADEAAFRAIVSRHPAVRRVLFSPRRSMSACSGEGGCLPVYGRYGVVVQLSES